MTPTVKMTQAPTNHLGHPPDSRFVASLIIKCGFFFSILKGLVSSPLAFGVAWDPLRRELLRFPFAAADLLTKFHVLHWSRGAPRNSGYEIHGCVVEKRRHEARWPN